ncbi:MAG: galactose-1-phosphate uridylyltransferase [Spirochaetales bacterium]|nr:galactose-1-phosphate uridylyltransferase [Spirochaetales bacterium]
MAQHEIRQNKISREWVIYSTGRGKRPHDFIKQEEFHLASEPDKKCPFCPGNEEILGPILYQLPGENQYTWAARCVPNKYPILDSSSSSKRIHEGIYLKTQGYGEHELIIESPFHNKDLADFSQQEMEIIIECYHSRTLTLFEHPQNQMVQIFRNRGPKAGASLIHPHSQIIASSIAPHYMRYREEIAQSYYDDHGCCIFCELLEYEIKAEQRMVYQNKHFTTLVPYAAEVPYEMWIIPHHHDASFAALASDHKPYLAESISQSIKRLYACYEKPNYNMVIHSCMRYKQDEPQLHWYIQIMPRLSTPAGFEIGSRIPINSHIPEEDALELRQKF